MDELLNYLRLYMHKVKRSRDLFYVISSKLNILDGHSGQIPAGPGHWHSNKNTKLEGECMSSRRPIFAVVFPTMKAINYSHVNLFIRFYWYYYIKVVKISQPASSAKIKPNPFRVISVFRILCKLGLSHAV